jgi:CheY-like chemotaxis protein
VVDDIKENRDLIVQILSFYGFKTLEASSGKEALELFDNQENQKIDLIFMDILMENLDGLQTIQIIRKKEKDFNVPIIALSANVFEEDKKQAINSGANDFLPKPVEEKDILLMLEKYLNIELIYDDKKDDLERNDISEELKNLPKEFFQKLNEKILLMDNEAILTLIKEYKLSFELQNHIENLVNEYKYQELMDLSKNQ